jgi:uncharacterized protein (DUF1800 family)
MRTLPPDAADTSVSSDASAVTEQSTDSVPSPRRAFLAWGAAAAAVAVAAPAAAKAQRAPRTGGRVHTSAVMPPVYGKWATGPSDPPSEWKSAEMRLVRRVTMGLSYAEIDRVRVLGYKGYLERQLNWQKLDDSRVDEIVATNYPLIALAPDQLYNQNQGTIVSQLQESTLFRSAFSERQLYQRMVEFWTDHFNINANDVFYLKVGDDRDVIRKHALGKVGDLVWASAHSPAMLEYLDNTRNRFPRPNQNYARELMELHTLGVDGGYTQDDVAELSRAFSGWTITGRGIFAFDPNGHDFGEKTILGQRIPAMPTGSGAAGIQDGERMIQFLVQHPSTAKYISTKMLRWLLRYDPTPAQISEVAAVYTKTRGDIKSMVRTILKQEWLVAAPPKLKRPYHFVISALRATSPSVTRTAAFNRMLTTVGQPLFFWETPDGYPDSVEYWGQNVLSRWNSAAQLASMASGDASVDVSALMRGGTADSVVQALDTFLFAGEMRARTRQGLTDFLRPAPTNVSRVRETLALALSSSGFQWY